MARHDHHDFHSTAYHFHQSAVLEMTADFFGNVVVAPSVADVAAGIVVVAAVVVVYAPVAAPPTFPLMPSFSPLSRPFFCP